jgi:hypothetical protein
LEVVDTAVFVHLQIHVVLTHHFDFFDLAVLFHRFFLDLQQFLFLFFSFYDEILELVSNYPSQE